jgi:hypothetical protein
MLLGLLLGERLHRPFRVGRLFPTAAGASLFRANLSLVEMLEFFIPAFIAFFDHKWSKTVWCLISTLEDFYIL